MDNPRQLRIGPEIDPEKVVAGDCPDCGGQCSPECGIHPLSCVFGGPLWANGYWMIADGCELDHGEQAA